MSGDAGLHLTLYLLLICIWIHCEPSVRVVFIFAQQMLPTIWRLIADCAIAPAQARNRWSSCFIANVVARIPIANTVVGQQRHADVETIGVADPSKPSLISLAKGYLNVRPSKFATCPWLPLFELGCIERCSPSSKEARWSNPCRFTLTSYVRRANAQD